MQEPRNAVAAAIHADPYPYYQRLRAGPALGLDADAGLWVASRSAVVEEALSHPALRVRPLSEPVPRALLGTAAGKVFARLVRMSDGAFHARHKPPLRAAAAAWSLSRIGDASLAAARALGPPADLDEWLSDLPVRVMAMLLGVPGADMDATVRQVRCFAQGIAPGAGAGAVALAVQAAEALLARGRGAGLDEVQAVQRIGLMQQSLDATAGLLGHTLLRLGREPALAARFAASPDFARSLVAEAERWCAPVQNTRRFAAQDLTLAGHAVRGGETVLLVLASANRDAALNLRPDAFEPLREGRRSLGFGQGAHGCPGAEIAIEIVACAARWLASVGPLDAYPARHAGYRPLPNARVPVFAPN